MRRLVLASLLALASVASAQAQTFTLPVTIGGSGAAKAADVGTDLNAIAGAINSTNASLASSVTSLSSSSTSASAAINSLTSTVAALAARVSKLEGNIVMADLAGTYTLSALQTEIGGVNTTSPHVASYVFLGSMTLTADGNGVFIGNQTGVTLNVANGQLSPANVPGQPGSFTWS